ncbi:putative NAD-dependent histone deacetylase [Cladorrhinum sp. PSN332]|nr:putative NAD-dependent histone deacetylase [Cladorrhinum sp. PSN332]
MKNEFIVQHSVPEEAVIGTYTVADIQADGITPVEVKKPKNVHRRQTPKKVFEGAVHKRRLLLARPKKDYFRAGPEKTANHCGGWVWCRVLARATPHRAVSATPAGVGAGGRFWGSFGMAWQQLAGGSSPSGTMPTTHVEPGSDALLQEIANSLLKARKVVVITGAGISTNSGIPDFRSENGLYSLIQAQFDAAAKQVADGNGDSDASDLSDERPTKRRRMSQEGLDSRTPNHPTEEESSEQDLAQSVKVEGDSIVALGDPEPPCQARDAPTPADAAHQGRDGNVGSPKSAQQSSAQDLPNPRPPTPNCDDALPDAQNLTPLPSPKFPSIRVAAEPRITQDPAAHFASSPPTLAVDALRLRTRPDLMDHRTRSSSPLSSPPPISFDPYQESSDPTSSGSTSGDGMSSRSASEGPSSASTPLLTSQTSFGSSSSRTTLPNMKGRDLFDAQIWSCPIKTSVFYTFATTLRQKVRNAQPTNSHRFVSVLRDSRKLVRCYTQNIDQLEERVGLSTSLSLGAGNRYRFSVKSGRNAGGRHSLKIKEASDLSVEGQTASQGANDDDSPRDNALLGESQQTSSQDEATNSDKTSGSSSEAGSGSNTANNEAATSIQAGANSAPAPPAPNRGVECVFLHGSLADLRCFVCARTAPWDDEFRQAETLAGRQPTCPHCAGATAAREERGKRALGVGKLRPDIVLYGEEHPNSHLVSHLVQHDLSLQPDMLLILGTSMRVHGLKVIVREFAKAVHDRGGKVVFVNFTKPPESVWADVIDMWVQWDCDAWVDDLQRRKPVLWLPPGTTLPEEPKPKVAKAPKASRRQSGGETGKRKEAPDAAPQKRRDSDGPARKPKRESTGSTIVVQPIQEVVKEIPRLRPQDPLPKEAPLQAQGPLPKEGLFMPPAPLSSSSPIFLRASPSQATPIQSEGSIPDEGPLPLRDLVPQQLPFSAPSSSSLMLPPPLPTSPPTLKPLPSRPARTPREPKLNPDAKRPASIRDHKLNGAYLTCKILKELKRITGETPVESAPASPVPAAPKSRAKKGRKSAPGFLETGPPLDAAERTEDNDVKMEDAPAPTKRKRKAKVGPPSDVTPPLQTSQEPEAPPPPAEPVEPVEESSISAMVKTRKRKRTVAWRMIRGVETQVSLDENGEIIVPLGPPPPPQRSLPPQRTDATFRPVHSPGFRALPEPVPSPLPSPLGYAGGNHNNSHKNSFSSIVDSGFRETDRLIAKSRSSFSLLDNAFHETDRLIARLQEESRPSTPVHLAPLNIPPNNTKPVDSPPKLEPLEPKVHSPGPRAEISSNVGSPILGRVPATGNNPFFFADPLVGHFSYPPMWAQPSQLLQQQVMMHPQQQQEQHQYQQQEGNGGGGGGGASGSYSDSNESWCPDEQLRKEQEVAMMLSVMRGASMLSPAPHDI